MNMVEMTHRMRENETIHFKEQVSIVTMLSIPAILEQLVITAMSYIDTAMVGGLGYEATASIGVVASATWLFGGIIGACAVGFSVQVAQYLGANRMHSARSVLVQSILFNITFGVLLGLIVLGISPFLPAWLDADIVIRSDASCYLGILAVFIPFNMASQLYSSLLRCSGNTLLPSLMNGMMCIFDVIFNAFFIFYLDMGVKGAALGTGMSQLVVGLILFICVIKRKGPLQLQGDETWKFDHTILKNAFQLGLPAALERITLSLAQIVMTSVVTKMGAVSVAVNYVAVQAESICYLPAYGIASASTALVGQSIGARRKDMAKRFAYLTTVLGFLLVLVMATIMYMFAPILITTLTNDIEVIQEASLCLRIVAFSEPLFAISIVVIGALRGAGDSKGPFYLNVLSMWGIRVLGVLLFTQQFGVIGVWSTMTFELVCRGIIFLVRMVRGKWLNQKVLV